MSTDILEALIDAGVVRAFAALSLLDSEETQVSVSTLFVIPYSSWNISICALLRSRR
jgi:hypothetical protein